MDCRDGTINSSLFTRPFLVFSELLGHTIAVAHGALCRWCAPSSPRGQPCWFLDDLCCCLAVKRKRVEPDEEQEEEDETRKLKRPWNPQGAHCVIWFQVELFSLNALLVLWRLVFI